MKTPLRLQSLGVVLLGILAFASAAPAAELITNGNFNSGSSNWNPVQPAGSLLQFTSNLAYHSNSPGAFFSGTVQASISQTFATTPGALYTFSFFYQIGASLPLPPGADGAAASNLMEVFFNGNMIFSNLDANPGFVTFTFTDQMATSNMTTVLFRARNGGGGADYIDDVSVTGQAVPDSGGTLLLLGLSAPGFLLAYRR